MLKKFIKQFVQKKLNRAGIEINGSKPWDIQVHDDRFYPNVALRGSLGMGESYMSGWIDSEQLDESINRILRAHVTDDYSQRYLGIFHVLGSILLNKQSKSRAEIVGKEHYDLGNDLFQAMLGKTLCYSCGYWKNASNLDEAQVAKLDLVCRKLYLKPGMRVLDIGCGWGSFAKFAAEKYGTHVVGISISQNQLDYAKEHCKGLPVELRYQDYRDLNNESFDRIVSIGQMEHVGYKNYSTYMQIVQRNLKEDGLFLLHTIGANRSYKAGDPWLEKYIFPNGMLPSIVQLAEASEGLFVMEDWHNFGAYYDKTLLAWYQNFTDHWDKLKATYGESFYRMWKYYLLSCAGTFRSRQIELWQIVYSKYGVIGGYQSLR